MDLDDGVSQLESALKASDFHKEAMSSSASFASKATKASNNGSL